MKTYRTLKTSRTNQIISNQTEKKNPTSFVLSTALQLSLTHFPQQKEAIGNLYIPLREHWCSVGHDWETPSLVWMTDLSPVPQNPVLPAKWRWNWKWASRHSHSLGLGKDEENRGPTASFHL